MKKSLRVATLMTCHNRKEKTLDSIRCLNKAITAYSSKANIDLANHLYITDDGCTDGTIDAIINEFDLRLMDIITSDGNAYWAGGMRLAWEVALKNRNSYDFYLLLNDDCKMKEDAFFDLINTDSYVREHCNQAGVYCGFISSEINKDQITYGAKYYRNSSWRAAAIDMYPTGTPQKCVMTNANILLVSSNVVDGIGILDQEYIHGGADFDYGVRAVRSGYPVYTTSGVCGYCEMDHDNSKQEAIKVKRMSIKERIEFLNKPTSHYHDSLIFNRRYFKVRYVMQLLAYCLNLFAPSLFYYLFSKRGH